MSLLDQNGRAAIDATFFDHGHASRHYARRSDRTIQPLKTTLIVDPAQNAVIDVHCSARWPGDPHRSASRLCLIAGRGSNSLCDDSLDIVDGIHQCAFTKLTIP
jgi:glutamine synthetase